MNCGFEDCVVLDELIEEQGELITANTGHCTVQSVNNVIVL